MKEAENKEIALLLKDLGRRQRSGAASVEPATHHLDADELSSFAEGVLPPATRALYAGHLADCDRCRSTVAKLAMAAGAAVQTKTEQVPAAGLWRYFEGIFSQKFMRFAVPVMSIVILAAIAFVWFKRDAREGQVAQTATTQPIDSLTQPTPPTGFFTEEQKNEQAKVDARSNQPAKATKEKTDSKGAAADNKSTAAENKPKEEGRTTETVSVVAGTEPAPPPASQPAPKPQARERDDAAEKKPEPTPTDTVAKTEVKDEDKGEGANKREEAEKKKADSEDDAVRRSVGISGGFLSRKQQAETKTVGGRRFVRQDNRWVDTAYQSSASLTNVTRNSEQYRALIGDEPGLRTIAEQLEGEVIVVWKGKTYRIR